MDLGVEVAVGVDVAVAVGVAVGVTAGVGVEVGVGVALAVAVATGVGVGVGWPWQLRSKIETLPRVWEIVVCSGEVLFAISIKVADQCGVRISSNVQGSRGAETACAIP